jgi:hypothetical protein
MRVIRGEPVEVWLRDGRPLRFVWRGRMYTVMLVLERRLMPAAEPAVAPRDPGTTERETMDPATGGSATQGSATAGSATQGSATHGSATEGSATEGSATEGSATTAPTDLKADARECWRVEATPERTLPPTTYELCHDLAGDRWLLSRS